jgi:hypothetical protein
MDQIERLNPEAKFLVANLTANDVANAAPKIAPNFVRHMHLILLNTYR